MMKRKRVSLLESVADTLITTEAAAQRLGVSYRTIQRLAMRKQLIPVRLGRIVRFRTEEITKLIRARS